MRNYLIVFACFLSFLAVGKAEASVVSPTIVKAENGYAQDGVFFAKPFIAGLNATGTEVLIYLDGVFAGLAQVNYGASGTDNFYYKYTEFLSEGSHAVMVVARDKTSLALSAPSYGEIVVGPLPAPTLVSPDEKTVTASVRPLITGLVPSGTNALIYIDGVYDGKLSKLNHQSGTANFAYKPFLNLSRGNHSVWAVTEDQSGRKSGASNFLNFRIEAPMPAPTILKPAANSRTEETKPLIVGVAKNDSLVKVYVDHKISGQFKVGQDKSGVVGFSYKPAVSLTSGSHIAYTVAADSRGKESSWSNIIWFTVTQPVVAKGTDEAVKKDESVKPSQDEVVSGQRDDAESVSADSKNKAENKDIKSDEKDKEFPLNLTIFIAFLLGIIGWIVWVNKELVKEKFKK